MFCWLTEQEELLKLTVPRLLLATNFQTEDSKQVASAVLNSVTSKKPEESG
jgi:hypothetical protein